MIAALRHFDAFAAVAVNSAICAVMTSLVGLAALATIRNASAVARHAIAQGVLVAALFIPAAAAVYQSRFVGGAVSPSHLRAPAPAAGRAGDGAPQPNVAVLALPTPPTDLLDPGRPINLSAFLVAAWGVGGLYAAARTLRAACRQRVVLGNLRVAAEQGPASLLCDLRREFGIRRDVTLLASDHAPCPFTMGVLRPQIVVPAALLARSSRQRLRAALAHELAHVARFDCAAAGLEGVVQILYWWNPFVRRIAGELAAAREEICDSYVLTHGGDGSQFAKYLLDSLEHVANARIVGSLGLSTGDVTLVGRRIQLLLSGERTSMSRYATLHTALVWLGAIALSLGLVHINYAHAQLAFGTPTPVAELNTPFGELARGISADGLSLYLSSQRPIPPATTASPSTLWVSTRATTSAAWGVPTPLVELDTAGNEFHPMATPDNLALIYEGPDLSISTRASTGDPWGPGQILPAPLNTPDSEGAPFLTADRLTILFDSTRPGGQGGIDLWMAERTALDAPWVVSNLGDVVNTTADERGPYLTSDGLSLFFASKRAGGVGDFDLYVSSRDDRMAPWGAPVNLGPQINTPLNDNFPMFWDEGKTLFFRSHGLASPQGQPDIFQVRVIAEPSTGMLALGGVALMGGCVSRRRRRR